MSSVEGCTPAKILEKETQADALIKAALHKMSVDPDAAKCEEVFSRQIEVMDILRAHNHGSIRLPSPDLRAGTISVSTTGKIIERFVELGLTSVLDADRFNSFARDEAWIGDFNVAAYPIALVVSCKSFKAKERLLVSGLGSNLIPTVGYGWFDEPKEFQANRLQSYLLRGFFGDLYAAENAG